MKRLAGDRGRPTPLQITSRHLNGRKVFMARRQPNNPADNQAKRTH